MLRELEGRINMITSENMELERKIIEGEEAKKQLFINRENLKDIIQDYFSEVRGDSNV